VKTVKFGSPKYVGDPINAVKIFNEKEVDEIMVVDIDATAKGLAPNYELIKNLASECRMPLCYGGGVKSVDQVSKIIGLGVEKVAMSAAVVANPDMVSRAAEVVGRQSVVVVMDVRKHGNDGKYEVVIHNGSRNTGLNPVDFSRTVENLGAGEVVINSIDRDGVMEGFDIDLVREIHGSVSIPITALGGAGSLTDIEDLIRSFGIIGAAAGSLFVFKGTYRAVLINYPDRATKDGIVTRIRQ
jgi:cyclase